MRDKIVWEATIMDTESHGRRTVYVKHYAVPFVGLMAAPDTAFTIPAYIVVKRKRVRGFVTPRDGMAFQQEHDAAHFVAFKGKGGERDD